MHMQNYQNDDGGVPAEKRRRTAGGRLEGEFNGGENIFQELAAGSGL